MYEQIHKDLLELVKSRKDFRLLGRRPNIGAALKQLQNEKRIRIRDLVKDAALNRNYLKTLIQMGDVNTSEERFSSLVKNLDVTVDEFIRLAQETSRYNFYQLASDDAPHFKYEETHEVEVYGPPSLSRKDFVWCLVRIRPGKGIHNLVHETMNQVGGFVTNGYLKLTYGDKSYSIHANQSFFFDPRIKHHFDNMIPSGATEFYLLYQPRSEPDSKGTPHASRADKKFVISTAALIDQIRRELSPDPNQLLPMPMLANLSGIELASLMHLTYRKTKIIPFEKIDRLASLTNYSCHSIIQMCEGRYAGWVEVFTDQDKVTVDLSPRFGVRFVTHTGIGTGKRKFTISDLVFDSWNEGSVRKEWKYQGLGFVGISVQRGKIGVQYGSQPLKILGWGDYLYLNADVEIKLSNLLSEEKARENGESPEAKATIFASPAIV